MFCQQRFVNNGRGHRHPKKEVTSHASLRISVTLILIKYEILRIRSPKEQDAQLSQRDRAAGCGYVLKRMFTKFSEIRINQSINQSVTCITAPLFVVRRRVGGAGTSHVIS